MGLRAFTSQLLCEQVVGRGLRRTSYEVDPESGLFEPEYVNIFGVPFTFLPHEGERGDAAAAAEAAHARSSRCRRSADTRSLAERAAHRARLPPRLALDLAAVPLLELDARTRPIQLAELAPTVDGKPDLTQLRRSTSRTSAAQSACRRSSSCRRRRLRPDEPDWPGSRELLLAQLIGSSSGSCVRPHPITPRAVRPGRAPPAHPPRPEHEPHRPAPLGRHPLREHAALQARVRHERPLRSHRRHAPLVHRRSPASRPSAPTSICACSTAPGRRARPSRWTTTPASPPGPRTTTSASRSSTSTRRRAEVPPGLPHPPHQRADAGPRSEGPGHREDRTKREPSPNGSGGERPRRIRTMGLGRVAVWPTWRTSSCGTECSSRRERTKVTAGALCARNVAALAGYRRGAG